MESVPTLYKNPWRLFKEIRQRFVKDSSVNSKTSVKAVQQFKTLLYLASVTIVCVL
jgi:hypothetical protein